MALPPLLLLTDVALTFGGDSLLDGVDLSVAPGERVALVGRNGTGKSTLLRIAAGLAEPDRGSRFLQPGTTLRYLAQEPEFSGHGTVLSYVEAGLGPGDDPHTARHFLEQLGLSGTEDPAHLSGGEARRAALARVLAAAPDILLLDEPTNHLDLPTIEWLERDLAQRRAALVLVSHDRRFLQNLAKATVWIDRGRARRLDRGFAEFEAWRDAVLEQEETERHKLDRKLVAEADWLRYGVTARRKRNVRRLAALYDMRAAQRSERRAVGRVRIEAGDAGLSGKLVIEAKAVAKDFGDAAIVRDFSIRVARGDRLGIVGPNGAGKTTLVSLLTGRLAPDAGTVRLGVNLEVAVLEQDRASLDPEETLANALTGGGTDTVVVGGVARHVVAYMGDFLFRPEQARSPLKVLSGGERARLMLARALLRPANLLVLDEPTNDLDLDTLDVLEEMLGDYAGTVLLISHDRDFLDRTVNAVLVPEGQGRWAEYAGGYTDMLAQRGQGLTVRGAPPRIPRARLAPAGGVAAPKPVARRRLGFHDKHALATLPARISALEAEIARLRAALADAGLYARDRAGFEAASAALGVAEADFAAAEERWLTLEMLREEIEG